MPTAHINGIDIHFERAGNGPRLLFCNGSGATLETSAPLIERLRRQFDVVAHDQRGLGRTEIPAGPYTMAHYAADAVGLLDHVGWDRCAVIGISFGGMVAQELAVTWPQRISRLALVCTSPGGPDRASYPLHELATLPDDEQFDVMTTIVDTRYTPEYLAAHPADQAMIEVRRARRDEPKSDGADRGEREQLLARRDHDVWDRLANITCATLVAGGRYDGIAPPSNSEAIASQIPGAEARLYEGGHLFFLQDPEAFPAITDFLAAPG